MVAIVLALVPATALMAKRVFDGSSSPGGSSTDLPIPPVSPSGTTPTTTPTTAPASPAPPATPAKHLAKISPDAPRRITSGALIDSGFDSSVTDLDASSDSEVARWDPRGSPGSPGTDTVYVLGRVRADGDSAFSELPKLTSGATVSIRTDSGTMTYTVSETKLKALSGLAEAALFTTHQPGRLVLVGIRYDASGNRLDKALVVTAELTGAKKS
ncbi:MAG TPA: class F sortase [Marmoricola sp.]